MSYKKNPINQVLTTNEVADELKKNAAYTLRLIKEHLVKGKDYRSAGSRAYIISVDGLEILKKIPEISGILQKVSPQFFVENYEILKSGQGNEIQNTKGYTDASFKMRVSKSKILFESNLDKETLEFIVRPNFKVDQEIKEKALKLLGR